MTLKQWKEGPSALDGSWAATGDVSFYIDGDLVHVVDNKPQRRRAAPFQRLASRRGWPRDGGANEARRVRAYRYISDFVAGIQRMAELEKTIVGLPVTEVAART